MSQPKTPKQLMDDFDPSKLGCWLTVIPGEKRHNIKAHHTSASALSRFGNYSYMLLYYSGDNGWELIARKCKQDHNRTCQHCGGPTFVPKSTIPPFGYYPGERFTAPDGTEMQDLGQFEYVRGSGNQILRPIEVLFLCDPCRSAGVNYR